MPLLIRLGIGLLLSGGIGWLAYQRGSLTASGALGALLIGTLTFGFGGPDWGIVLIVFFVSSSALGHLGERRKAALKSLYEKGEQRDLGQVLANGGLAALIALLYTLSGERWLWAAYLGALATVNADTWATELGPLSQARPRLIMTWQPVPCGTSGGVTLAGFAASLGGGLVIGMVGVLTHIFFASSTLLGTGLGSTALPILSIMGGAAVGALGGLIGSVADSLLGATLQAMFQCADRVVEKPLCADGSSAKPISGRLPWLRNDGVNFLSSVVGALVGTLLYRWLQG